MSAMVDYSGEYLCKSHEHMDELFKSLGVGWAQRKLASAMNFGVNKATLTIEQEGNTIRIENRGAKTTKNELQVGGGEQTVKGEDGEIPARAEWGENGELVLYTKMKGKDVVITRKLLDGGKTLEVTIDNGTVQAKRLFERQN